MVTSKNQVVEFSIENIDPMGQGVAKNLPKINFIPKTLPGETGLARVNQDKKGVLFSSLVSLKTESELRIPNLCSHFDECGGCHFLHTSYENEIKFKMLNLSRLVEKFMDPKDLKIEVANERFFYRNRIQLHYDKKMKRLGFYKTGTHQIVNVPNCKVANLSLIKELNSLYENDSWLKLTKNGPNSGTIELYQQGHEVKIAINKPYAHLGFTQVNQGMNDKLKKWVATRLNPSLYTLELFAGDGNLTDKIPENQKMIFDFYDPKIKLKSFQRSVDLYQEKALNTIKNELSDITSQKQLVIDPPRSGLKNLDQWIELFKPKEFIYISCNPQTFKRDILNIHPKIKKIDITSFDLFPGTHHLEIACQIILH